jgi:hypothetical protein
MIQYMSSFNNKTPVAALFKLDPGGNAIEAWGYGSQATEPSAVDPKKQSSHVWGSILFQGYS